MENWKFALSSIMGHKMRSFLTMLGIIIGVASVVVIMALGQGMTKQITDMFSADTRDIEIYYVAKDSDSKSIFDDDVETTSSDKGPKIQEEWLQKIDGVAGKKVMESLADIAPDLGRFIIEFAFGDIYSREGLSLQEREIITITSLLTQGGCEAQLDVHINGSLNVGISPEKIIETFIQCIPYVGFPRVLNATFVAKKIFAERNVL